jgi:hypothetical protein
MVEAVEDPYHHKTLAKQQEALIQTDFLMLGKIVIERIKVITFRQWCEIYLKLESVKKLGTYVDRIQTIKVTIGCLKATFSLQPQT